MGPEGLGNKNDIEDPWENGEGMDLGLGDSSAGGHVQGPPSQEPVPVPEKPVLSNQAVNIISALAAVARDCILESADCGVVTNVHVIVDALRAPPELAQEFSHVTASSG